MEKSSLTSPPAARRRWEERPTAAYRFLAPFLAVFLVVYVLPTVYALYEAFFAERKSGLGIIGASHRVFVGGSNFWTVLTSSTFWSGVERLAVFGAVQIPLMMALALAAALLLDTQRVRFRRFARFSLFLPYSVPAAVGAILWAFLYLPSTSPLTRAIRLIPGAASFSFFNSGTVLWSILNMTTWEFTGFDMLIFLSALQSISPTLYEAARVDGASDWRIARYVKVPLLVPAFGMTAMFSIIGTLQMFNRPTILTSVTPNIGSTYTPSMYSYAAAFDYNNYNLAAAVALVLAVLIGLVALSLFSWLSRRGQVQ